MDHSLLIAVIVLDIIAIADVWTSQLSRSARVLWSLMVVFMVGVGLLAWLMTRHSAHRPVPELPEAEA